jgi:hypothetical protein
VLPENAPRLIQHCDWGKAESARWKSTALLIDGVYRIDAPEPVGSLTNFLPQIQSTIGSRHGNLHSENVSDQVGSALIGFDFPIGIPGAYAAKAGVTAFPDFLAELGKPEGPWESFFEICREASEISLQHPFYPYNFTPKGSRFRQHLVDGLGLTDFNQLLRICELRTETRSAAGALFWTLGAKAPGRGAIEGWKHLLIPAIASEAINLWPFEGTLSQLLKPGRIVIAESYPTQYYPFLVSKLEGSKRDRLVRATAANSILTWAKSRKDYLDISPLLETQIYAGFPRGSDDAFDSLMGLLGMIEVASGQLPEGRHPTPALSKIEGWILGQA